MAEREYGLAVTINGVRVWFAPGLCVAPLRVRQPSQSEEHNQGKPKTPRPEPASSAGSADGAIDQIRAQPGASPHIICVAEQKTGPRTDRHRFSGETLAVAPCKRIWLNGPRYNHEWASNGTKWQVGQARGPNRKLAKPVSPRIHIPSVRNVFVSKTEDKPRRLHQTSLFAL